MNETVKKLMKGVIISCQAYESTPLYGSEYMVAMAKSAEMGGANGIRACWPQDVKAIKENTTLPVIGIFKDFGDGDPLDDIFITPTLEKASAIVEAGCDVLALDCTIRKKRSFEELKRLLMEIKEKYPYIPIMADLATLDEAVKVAKTGYVDIISTTLSGYTRDSMNKCSDGPDVQLIRDIKKYTSLPVNAEGRIWELGDLELVIEAGADIVSIGSAVTRPQLITERFVKGNHKYRNS
ncbi:N-acetylmannosamine-6-phosphate 2-epimerase [Thomasclavelia ramosa]|uniref:N-acetylmannosamine-6-phosphate 2-epimerase n=1 Tax=Thomasclavelia ramosa TaxID=1547 RepID=UPI001C2C6474|nr:putative N-acetylmannosamine-6-phosphate 2-epimerase [Thomasclavelia ramosa]MBU9878163.1 putative N-acetylmannosamine-6-phosphate 2-epimerase [Thomasclavelia ramosa]MBV4098264.1 putative N-acetylmannosamine-6-phosphate 2-epimerase [Thomasclavelia ramosa]MBV4120077.1 putative N-acetylmannosamine-6-phosphate 2-epimerase [Thomasclavelia ramosa]